MIERVKAKDGQTILKLNGRQICTSLNPLREARDWVKKNSRRFAEMKTVIVIGVGCGFHLAEIRRRFENTKIVALDFNQELIDFSAETHGLDLVGAELIKVGSVTEVAKNSTIRAAIAGSYAVVRFMPCTNQQLEQYNELECTMLGRNILGFKMVVGARARMGEIFNPKVNMAAITSNPTVTIKSLFESLGPNETSESLMVRALRELVN